MAFLSRSSGESVLKNFTEKPPANNKALYKTLTTGIKDLMTRLCDFEQKYYGKGKTSVEEMRKWRNHVRNIVIAFHMGSFRSAVEMEGVFKRSSEADCPNSFDVFDMNKVKEVYSKIRTNITEGGQLATLFADAQLAYKYLLRYCSSFYIENDMTVLETADKYEKQRRNFDESLSKHLCYLSDQKEKFLYGELLLADLGINGTELIRKSECYFAPFLALVPEACENLRAACAVMASWVTADSVYAEFISHDIEDLEAKQRTSLASKRRLHQQCHQLAFRKQRAENERDKLSATFYEMELNESDLIVEEEILSTEINEMQLEIERKESRRDGLIKNAAKMHPTELYAIYNELSEALREINQNLPVARRQLSMLRNKLEAVATKKEELKKAQAQVAAITKQADEAERDAVMCDVTHEKVSKQLDMARKIHLLKTSPDTLEKMFYGRPVDVNNKRLPDHEEDGDLFGRACAVAASRLMNDWQALYRALVFHPPRGLKTMDQDIAEIAIMSSRLASEQVALRAINRWRRFHTRAKLEDLLNALRTIKRLDIVNAIDSVVNPPRSPSPKEELANVASAGDALYPYLRLVERWDEMRASNKFAPALASQA